MRHAPLFLKTPTSSTSYSTVSPSSRPSCERNTSAAGSSRTSGLSFPIAIVRTVRPIGSGKARSGLRFSRTSSVTTPCSHSLSLMCPSCIERASSLYCSDCFSMTSSALLTSEGFFSTVEIIAFVISSTKMRPIFVAYGVNRGRPVTTTAKSSCRSPFSRLGPTQKRTWYFRGSCVIRSNRSSWRTLFAILLVPMSDRPNCWASTKCWSANNPRYTIGIGSKRTSATQNPPAMSETRDPTTVCEDLHMARVRIWGYVHFCLSENSFKSMCYSANSKTPRAPRNLH